MRRSNLIRQISLGMLLIIGLAACDDLFPPEPTATKSIDDSPTLAPSPTVVPLIPTESADSFIGRSDPTQAGLAGEGQPTDDPTFEILPTEPTIPLTVIAGDGALLRSTFYGAPVQPAPALLLVHGESGDVSELGLLAYNLQQAGYNVMVLTLRGYGTSSGVRDWSKAGDDVRAAFDTLRTLPNVLQLGAIGQGAGGTAAILGCGQYPTCQAAVVLNPLPQPQQPALDQVGINQPILIVAGEDQPESLLAGQTLNVNATGEHTLLVYPTITFAQPAIATQLINWLQGYLLITP